MKYSDEVKKKKKQAEEEAEEEEERKKQEKKIETDLLKEMRVNTFLQKSSSFAAALNLSSACPKST